MEKIQQEMQLETQTIIDCRGKVRVSIRGCQGTVKCYGHTRAYWSLLRGEWHITISRTTLGLHGPHASKDFGSCTEQHQTPQHGRIAVSIKEFCLYSQREGFKLSSFKKNAEISQKKKLHLSKAVCSLLDRL